MIYLAILLSLIFIGVGISSFFKNWQKNRINVQTKKYIQTCWQKIENLPEDRIKEAIFEADKLLDYTLTKLGAKGINITPKIQKMGHLFSNEERILKAHRFRNRLAHDINFEPTKSSLVAKLSDFKQALIDLGIYDIG